MKNGWKHDNYEDQKTFENIPIIDRNMTIFSFTVI